MGLGLMTLIMSGLGIVAMMFHYVTHEIYLGIICTVLLVGAFIISTIIMKKREKEGDFVSNMYNFAMLGHGSSGVVAVVGGVMCLIANIMKFPAH